MEKSHRLYLVYLSLMFSLVLAVVPLPAMVKLFRPDWPLLVLFYWALALPFRVSIGTAFVVGFYWMCWSVLCLASMLWLTPSLSISALHTI